jgi:hypothetical protein
MRAVGMLIVLHQGRLPSFDWDYGQYFFPYTSSEIGKRKIIPTIDCGLNS